jgi:hypothetical protein
VSEVKYCRKSHYPHYCHHFDSDRIPDSDDSDQIPNIPNSDRKIPEEIPNSDRKIPEEIPNSDRKIPEEIPNSDRIPRVKFPKLKNITQDSDQNFDQKKSKSSGTGKLLAYTVIFGLLGFSAVAIYLYLKPSSAKGDGLDLSLNPSSLDISSNTPGEWLDAHGYFRGFNSGDTK